MSIEVRRTGRSPDERIKWEQRLEDFLCNKWIVRAKKMVSVK